MSERYSKLFALSEDLYSAGAPVVIAAGALQKDNQTGKVFAQLKIRNIQDKAIKAATVKITPFDTVGKPLGRTVDYQYLDLSAGREADFGQKAPVMFPDAGTRSFSASVVEVVYSDNSVWTASNGTWEALSAPVSPEKAFSDNELAKQYRVKYGADCKCIFNKEKDLWRCACGAINHDGEKNCHRCRREAAALAALDLDELKADRDRRLAAEQKQAAEEKAAAEVKAKKTKKIVMIAVPIVVVAIVAAVLISNFVEEAVRQDAYNAAVALAESGQYDEAITAFMELEDYKDSAELAAQIQAEVERQKQYDRAISQMNAGYFESAIEAFQELGDYKDSAAQVEKARNLWNEELYTAALDYYHSGEPVSLPKAWNNFNECSSDYKDTQQYKDEIDGILKQLAGKYTKPDGTLEYVVTLYDSTDGFRIDCGSGYRGHNVVDTTIAWVIEDGQVVYGYKDTDKQYHGQFTVTLVEGGIHIDTDVHAQLAGTYLKK